MEFLQLAADDSYGLCSCFSGIYSSFLHLCLFNWPHGTCSVTLILWLVDAIVHSSTIGLPWDLHQFLHQDLKRFSPLSSPAMIWFLDFFFQLNFMFWMGLPFAMCVCRLGRYCLPPQPPLPCCLLGNTQPVLFSFICFSYPGLFS